VASEVGEIVVGGEHHQVVGDAKLGEQGVDCVDLDTMAAALIAKICRCDVILALRNEPGKRAEPLDD